MFEGTTKYETCQKSLRHVDKYLTLNNRYVYIKSITKGASKMTTEIEKAKTITRDRIVEIRKELLELAEKHGTSFDEIGMNAGYTWAWIDQVFRRHNISLLTLEKVVQAFNSFLKTELKVSDLLP